MPFSFRRLEIPDVVLIEPRVFEDEPISRAAAIKLTYNFTSASIPLA